MKIIKLFAFAVLTLLLNSCNTYKSPSYNKFYSPQDLSATYVDLNDGIAPYFNLTPDESDIYQFNFKDDKTLELSHLTPNGLEVIKTYKGTHKKKQNYFQITLENKVIPLLFFNDIARDLLKIGVDSTNNILLERNRSRTVSILFFMYTETLFTNHKLINVYEELTHLPINENGKWGYGNRENKIIITPKYDFVRTFEKDADVARVKSNGKWGYITKNGTEIVPLEYNSIERFGERNYAAIFKENSGLGLVDKKGNFILPAEYDNIIHMDHSTLISLCQLKDKLGVVYYDKLIYEPVFDHITNTVSDDLKFNAIKEILPNYLCEVKIGKNSYYADLEGFLYPKKGSLKKPEIKDDEKVYYKNVFQKF